MNGLLDRVVGHPWANLVLTRFARSPLTRRFVSGAGWSMVGSLAWKGFAAVANILLARILGPQGVGELGIIRSTAATFEVFAGLRLGATATRYVAEHRSTDPARAAKVLRLSLLATLVLCGTATLAMAGFAPWLARHALDHPDLAGLLVIGAVMIFVNVYGRVQELALAGFERFRAIAGVNAWRGLGNLLICVPLAYFFGVTGALVGLIVVAAVVMGRYALLLRRETAQAGFPRRVPLSGVRTELPMLWNFALPGFLATVIMAATLWAARAVLVRQDGGFVELGLFEAAQHLRFPIAFLPAMLAPVVLPLLARAHGAGADRDFRATMGLQLRTVILINLPIAIALIGFAEPLSHLFGDAFAGLAPVIALAAIPAFLYSINTSVTRAFDGVGRRWVNALFFVLWSAAFLLAGVHWMPTLGAIGLSLANLVAEVVMIILQVLYVDLVLVPGALRGHAMLLVFAIVLLGGALLAYFSLPTAGAMVAAVGLCLIAVLPVLVAARRRLR